MIMMIEDIKEIFEEEEKCTVSDSFGGKKTSSSRAKSFSIITVIEKILSLDKPNLKAVIDKLEHEFKNKTNLESRYFIDLLKRIIRFSFIIELTNLGITSTKMKTRWLAGKINYGEGNSTIIKEFSEFNLDESRSNSFDECFNIFIKICNILTLKLSKNDERFNNFIKKLLLDPHGGTANQFIFSYKNFNLQKIHTAENIKLCDNNDDIIWLLDARKIIYNYLDRKLKEKIQVKSYLTDRSLTGKDKTNRAKRWEIIPTDYQFASIEDCWSVERKLLEQLVFFEEFNLQCKNDLLKEKLINDEVIPTLCPITLEHLNFNLINEKSEHGKSAFQVGHLIPLKRGGIHHRTNISWQSGLGNRIQGDLTVNEAHEIIDNIYIRRQKNKNK